MFVLFEVYRSIRYHQQHLTARALEADRIEQSLRGRRKRQNEPRRSSTKIVGCDLRLFEGAVLAGCVTMIVIGVNH